MEQKVLKTLEFDKILDKLSAFTQNESVKDRIFTLVPSADINEIKNMQGETAEAVGLILRRGNPPGLLIRDIRAALKRLDIGGFLSIAELLSVSGILKLSKQIKNYINDDKILTDGIISEINQGILPQNNVVTRIDECIISQDEIADTASSELYNIRKKIRSSNSKIRETLNGMIASSHYQKYLQEPIITMRGDRYCVPVKAECKNEVKGIVHDSSSTGQTVFVEPMAVVALTNELAELFGREKNEIERILQELSAFVYEYSGSIMYNIEAILKLDFIFCKAKLAVSQNAVEPKMNENGYINIKKGRHPLLNAEKVVPVDIYLGGDFDTLVITGPNTGGKTVSLKTLGLFTLMAQSGLHIPCSDNSETAVFDNVFADIGDEQSIEQSLSTFSSHIVNLVKILKKVTYNSLVLADELGAGTDPTEGAALAISILEHLRRVGAKTAVTTHYSELKMFALSTEGVQNASCEFDVATLSPTYKLLIGVPGKSNAFAISKRLGVENNIIDRARELLSSESVKLEDVIVGLEADKKQAEYEKTQAEILSENAKKIRALAQKDREETNKKRAKVLEDARREALRIVEDAKENAQGIIKEIKNIRDTAVSKDAWVEADSKKQKLNEKSVKIAEQLPKQKPVKPPKDLRLGEDVLIVSMEQEASVLTLPNNSGELYVQAGIMKIKTNINDLKRIKTDTKTVNSVSTYNVSKSRKMNAKTEVDVRGQNLEEAIENVDKFIDDALMSSLHTITIIHGKGTGVLRRGIGDFLKHHHAVDEYRSGLYGEGENGVTVVTLK